MQVTGYHQRRARAASDRGRRMAEARWQADRERRRRLAALAPLNYPGRISLRVVVIRQEQEVSEAVVFDTDSTREARRKIRALGIL